MAKAAESCSPKQAVPRAHVRAVFALLAPAGSGPAPWELDPSRAPGQVGRAPLAQRWGHP